MIQRDFRLSYPNQGPRANRVSSEGLGLVV